MPRRAVPQHDVEALAASLQEIEHARLHYFGCDY